MYPILGTLSIFVALADGFVAGCFEYLIVLNVSVASNYKRQLRIITWITYNFNPQNEELLLRTSHGCRERFCC